MSLYQVTSQTSGILDVPPIIEFSVKAFLNYAYPTTNEVVAWYPIDPIPNTAVSGGYQIVVEYASGRAAAASMLTANLAAAVAKVTNPDWGYGLTITATSGTVTVKSAADSRSVTFTPDNPPSI